MGSNTVRRPRRRRKLTIIILVLLLLSAAMIGMFGFAYYRADETAKLSLQSDETVSVAETPYGWLFDGPSEDAALIFYPGGMVEETAYAPLLHELAAQGMDACLVKMPFRLAVLHETAADRVLEMHDYARWYVGGHSLGGVIAARYAVNRADDLCGIILLAAYPVRKVPDPLTEILIIGAEDRVVNWNDVVQGRDCAPTHYIEHIIRGGNHAQFGSYGAQRGDGTAAISAAEQVRETVRVILESAVPASS